MLFRDTLSEYWCCVKNMCTLPWLWCQAHNILQTCALRLQPYLQFQQIVFHVEKRKKKKSQGDRFGFPFILKKLQKYVSIEAIWILFPHSPLPSIAWAIDKGLCCLATPLKLINSLGINIYPPLRKKKSLTLKYAMGSVLPLFCAVLLTFSN